MTTSSTNPPEPSSSMSRIRFKTSRNVSTRFSPSIGRISLSRTSTNELTVETPGVLTATSRGVVPHLTRDHVALSPSIKWVHVPFETFLERDPPIPTQLPDETSFRSFLGFKEESRIISMSLRDPWNWKELPANGNGYISAHCIRGVRRVTPAQYRFYISRTQPDIVFALSDTPYTSPPFSQKRITKSIDKSASWLADILQAPSTSSQPTLPPNTGGKIKKNNASPMDMSSYVRPPNVFVHMAGDTSEAARRAFAEALTETLHGNEAETVKPLKCLDEGVAGYVFDLVPLRKSLLATGGDEGGEDAAHSNSSEDVGFATNPHSSEILPSLTSLLRTSLSTLPPTKARIITGIQSPHEILQLVRDVGVDVFDARWAQRAADWGVALDFSFPAPALDLGPRDPDSRLPRLREDGLRDIGHNLYDARYATDFSSFGSVSNPACPCFACSPVHPDSQISHSTIDETYEYLPTEPFTRAYVHHLLHTHEMSAHALLVGHNLAAVDSFFTSIRSTLSNSPSTSTNDDFAVAVETFFKTYDAKLRVFAEAKRDWATVEYARGKGRMARERAKRLEMEAGSKDEEKEPLILTGGGLEGDLEEDSRIGI